MIRNDLHPKILTRPPSAAPLRVTLAAPAARARS
jgi:hypothetical protein